MKCHAKAKKRSWKNLKSYIDRILVPKLGCGKVNGQHLKNLRPAWVRARATAGLSDVRLHDLRCTVGSWLVREGSSLHLVGAVLDHKGSEDDSWTRVFSNRRSASGARPTWAEGYRPGDSSGSYRCGQQLEKCSLPHHPSDQQDRIKIKSRLVRRPSRSAAAPYADAIACS